MEFEKIRGLLKGVRSTGESQGWELYNHIIRNKPENILELGHFHGCSTMYMAAALDEIGSGHIDTVDLELTADLDPRIENLAEKCGLSKYITVHREKHSYTWFLKKKIESQTRNHVCEPCYDLTFIDGPKNWEIDGFAFLLADKLTRKNGWILFDDYGWTYGKAEKKKGKTVADGLTIRAMSDDQVDTPNIERVFQLLVRQHPEYTDCEVQDEAWAWARKCDPAEKSFDCRTDRSIGDLRQWGQKAIKFHFVPNGESYYTEIPAGE